MSTEWPWATDPALERAILAQAYEGVPCGACGAEVNEPCRPGCLGYAIEHDGLAGTEPCS